MSLFISSSISLPDHEIVLSPIRAQGAGGQNVNKVSSAIHLRFDIKSSSLPDAYKTKLLTLRDSRLTQNGEIVLKAQQHRTQEKNKEDALQRLATLIRDANIPKRNRKTTKPSVNARKKRVDKKTKHGKLKKLRKKVSEN